MITREQIRNLLNGIGDETISKSDADQMAADYPYFSIPQLLYLKFTPGAMPDEKRIQQALIYASPHAHLETILGIEGESFADLYPKAPRTDSTMQAIDLFLFHSFMEGLSVSMVEAQCAGLPCVVSDRIPREAALTDQVSFLSLETAPRQWACEIERVRCMASRRTGYYQQIADAGYDIVKNAEWLQNYYLGQWNKTR